MRIRSENKIANQYVIVLTNTLADNNKSKKLTMQLAIECQQIESANGHCMYVQKSNIFLKPRLLSASEN